MPQTKAAEKALRVSDRRRAVNDRWRRAVREALLGVRDAIAAGKKEPAQAAYILAQKTLDRAARRNIIHRNKTARKKSRLQKAIAKLA